MKAGDWIYQSSTKGPTRIGDMASPHLVNAWRKLGGTSLDIEDEGTLPLRDAMWTELCSRGCVYDSAAERWVFPEKEATP